MSNLFPMKIGNEEGRQLNKKDILFMYHKTILSLRRRNKEAYFMVWIPLCGFTSCSHGHVCCQGLREGRVEEPPYRTITLLPVSYRGVLDLTPKLQCPVWLSHAPRARSWGRGLHQGYPHLFSSGSMALEERFFSLKMTFDKWGRNNHHIQKTNQASQEICM